MSDKNPEAGSPMDPTAKESSGPGVVRRNPRNCWALATLVAEVESAFGEAIVTYIGEPDSWGVNHEVTFESDDITCRAVLLEVCRQDERVAEAVDQDEFVLVRFLPKRTLRDSRDGFGLAEVYNVYTEPDTTGSGTGDQHGDIHGGA